VNKTVQLVNEWAEFEAAHPDASIDDFCRHRVISMSRKDQKADGPLTGGVVPGISAGLLSKIIGRLSKLNMSYQNNALAGTGLNQIEEFGILVTIRQQKNPRKTDVIFANLFELSSGSDMLKRLEKRNLIREYADKEDKRSKRIELTVEGEQAIRTAIPQVEKVAKMLMNTLPEDDRQLCIQLLKGLEIKFSALWQQHKGKPFDEVFDEVMGA